MGYFECDYRVYSIFDHIWIFKKSRYCNFVECLDLQPFPAVLFSSQKSYVAIGCIEKRNGFVAKFQESQ